MRPLLLALVALALGAAGCTGGDNGAALVIEDATDDCREPGRDFGDRCDAGADVTSMELSLDGDVLMIDVGLVAPPPLDPSVIWRIQINVATAEGRVCGASNAVDDDDPGDAAIFYGFDPAFGLDPLTRQPLTEGICETSLEGAKVRFEIDVTGQDPAEEFRVGGFTRLEYVDHADEPGSEDDFGFRGVLADLS